MGLCSAQAWSREAGWAPRLGPRYTEVLKQECMSNGHLPSEGVSGQSKVKGLGRS